MPQRVKIQSPIMQSLDSHEILQENDDNHYNSINQNLNVKSFQILDEDEQMKIKSEDDFCIKLQCDPKWKLKVVSIFGNTGDGKSHTMNHIFFNEEEVFRTSNEQDSQTIGAYAALQKQERTLCVDTEGLLGISNNSATRDRMLLKILAISDIIIYRTRAERLHRDMYEFLGFASETYRKFFAKELELLAASAGTSQAHEPTVIIFHETRNTNQLLDSTNKSVDEIIRENFQKQDLKTFNNIRYVGLRTDSMRKTDFKKIKAVIKEELESTKYRSPREAIFVYKALREINSKFSGQVEQSSGRILQHYLSLFTCRFKCESCSRQCQLAMGHERDGKEHMHEQPCSYQHRFDNKVYLCKKCKDNGERIIVELSMNSITSYLWKGSVIVCPKCGEIYSSHKHWYGNKPPEAEAVSSEIVHVWEAKGTPHTAQMVVDSVTTISDKITNISAPFAKALKDWGNDKIAPPYWKRNQDIILCEACKKNFEKTGLPKHHCRGCGEGFCHNCSSHKMPVPARGWAEPVRVCNSCREKLQKEKDVTAENVREEFNQTNSNHNHNNTAGIPSSESDILVRKYSENIMNVIGSVATVALEYPKDLIKDSARPTYWKSDAESPNCSICKRHFGTAEEVLINGQRDSMSSMTNGVGDCWRHHCRRCGNACCDECSQTNRPVPERGWSFPVRICDDCANAKADANIPPYASADAN